MTEVDILAEAQRLTELAGRCGWPKVAAEISCIPGPYPWPVSFFGFQRPTQLIQGRDLPDAIAKAEAWLTTGARASA